MLRFGEVGAPSTPAGAMRRPFSSTSVRLAPMPRRFAVATPGPSSRTKPEKERLELHAGCRTGFLQYLAGVNETGLTLHIRTDDLQGRDARVGAALDPRPGNDDFLDDTGGLRFGQGRQGCFFLGLFFLGLFFGRYRDGVCSFGLLRQRWRGNQAAEAKRNC